MGSSYMQYISQDPFDKIVALNGKWGSCSEDYYKSKMRHKLMPRRVSLETLDVMMKGFSDGFIPDFSACSTNSPL